ncbi:hypothetical protein GPECTOR_62g892 [Gonium pectorale]|uniref:Uncharacterized protein n=1 Tax=Gonium pectorale TaxID=33097 RepID=A0A150FTG5_GONPE|nr:hypothetical protein GPECTOR_1420g625 [Gonium pectorale]KXZ44777.1 hypothetical protein GPECTOR_62g892 [Gonium pectorale]|eukprot:KXZ40902.1 hypothetical protein GPECTOR_1420g625 [Gonium pectorale]
MEVDPNQRESLLSVAKKVRVETGAVIVPYLTERGMALRKQRTDVFRELNAQGFMPKWVKGADIRYVKDGESLLYKF